ncbi:GSCFA domain-containing protein [uncultured Enterovirga sp.]|uniref:GSCFA domain-containing protein n=1 Tax=uncultured Enterovirga sp. TaxID=2026352 RepID=UPI0035CB100B
MADHPYARLPAERYWRKAVAGVPPFALDPTRPDAFQLTRTEKIATAGSCFAQEVARVLQDSGYHYHVAEPPPARAETASPEAGTLFSARYGNIYTTRHLVQLLDRARGRFRPALSHWQRPDGRFVDPFRPTVEPSGYGSPAEVEAAREMHLACVRDLFETLDTFVFTLGLTEGWTDRLDGAALPVPPGVVAGDWDRDRYAFVNATASSMTDDLVRFVDGLRELNPPSRVILTVSPVPMVATMEDRHVMVSNAYSKSALRVAAEEVCRARPEVFYFPSFEIITSPVAGGRYFRDDLRSVNEAGIRHVMRLFLRHAGGEAHGPVATSPDWTREAAQTSQVICDEEALDS